MKVKNSILATALMIALGLSATAQTPQAPQNKMYQPREFTELAFEGILLDINQQTRIDSLNAAVKAKCQQAAPCDKAVKPCKDQAKSQDKTCCKDKANCQDQAKCQDKAKCNAADKGCKFAEKAGAEANCPKDKANCPKEKANCPKDKKDCKKAQGPRHPAGFKGQGRCPYGDEYVSKVKEILTPEQYVVFLENIVDMPAQKNAPQMQGANRGGHHKDMKKCDNKCEKMHKQKKADKK